MRRKGVYKKRDGLPAALPGVLVAVLPLGHLFAMEAGTP